jgi:hypothetical protein
MNESSLFESETASNGGLNMSQLGSSYGDLPGGSVIGGSATSRKTSIAQSSRHGGSIVERTSDIGGARKSSMRSTMAPGESKSIYEGPKVTLDELISMVRHGRFSQIKDALDFLPTKPFDSNLIQVKLISY